jgi:L-threonylcarbamoyladenylate synthase
MRLNPHSPGAIVQATQALARGELLGLPTETVYGLAARADDDNAVGKIFTAKGRPTGHPLIVHVAQTAQVHHFAAHWPVVAQRLAEAFWPGPLTLIVPRQAQVASSAAGRHASIALRCPAHPVAQAVLTAALALGVPGVAAPSANRFGRISPTTAQHVLDEFGSQLLVLDGGACALGIESSIVDCSRAHVALLRPGVLTSAELQAAAGEFLHNPDAQSPQAPGTLKAHYMPQAKLRLMPIALLETALDMLGQTELRLGVYAYTLPQERFLAMAPKHSYYRSMPTHPAQAAHELFSALREFDAQGVELIWVEEPPLQAEWAGVRDRLQRAGS